MNRGNAKRLFMEMLLGDRSQPQSHFQKASPDAMRVAEYKKHRTIA